MRSFVIFLAVALTLPIAFVPHTLATGSHSPQLGVGLTPPPQDAFSYVPGALADVELGGGTLVDDASTAGTSSDPDVPDEYAVDTSDYMLGTAVASVVFMESNGSEEPESEDWSAARKDEVLQGVRSGFDFWETEAPNGRFDVHLTSTTVETGVEPIRHPGYTGGECENNFVWMHDAMLALGYDPGELECQGDGWDWSTYNAIRSYAHDLRNAHDRDWGFVVFVVDSFNDEDGKFADGKFAYAYRGGPRMVLTYDNDEWGIDDMDFVAGHELGHIFGATDEYTNPGEVWGYLWERETDDSGCIMDSASWCVSPGSANQLGWRDSDGDGLPDPVDTRPDVDGVEDVAVPRFTNDTTVPVAGAALDVPYPADPNFTDYGFHSISVNDVTSVEWTVDGGSTSSAATDVADPHAAPWSFETGALAEGDHTVTVQAANQVGNLGASPVTRDMTVDTTVPSVTLVHPRPGTIYLEGFVYTPNPADPQGEQDPLVVGPGVYIEAEASDALAGVAYVDVYIDGEFETRLTERPYDTWQFELHDPGSYHEVEVVAVDGAGNSASDTVWYRAAS